MSFFSSRFDRRGYCHGRHGLAILRWLRSRNLQRKVVGPDEGELLKHLVQDLGVEVDGWWWWWWWLALASSGGGRRRILIVGQVEGLPWLPGIWDLCYSKRKRALSHSDTAIAARFDGTPHSRSCRRYLRLLEGAMTFPTIVPTRQCNRVGGRVDILVRGGLHGILGFVVVVVVVGKLH